MNTFQVDIVSAEGMIFQGKVERLFLTGVEGEMEILANHTPLLSALAPGPVWAKTADREEAFVILGGIIEVQPNMTIILADSAIRAADIDEAAANDAVANVELSLQGNPGDIDYQKVHSELATAVAQLRVIRKLRETLK